MTPQELAESVKRFRELSDSEYIARGHGLNALGLNMLATINALVQLVAELYNPADVKQESDALAKASPIAQLAKDE